MINKEKLNEYLELKNEMENYAEEIAETISTKGRYMSVEHITIDDEDVSVTYSGHCQGYYEEEVYFSTSYLSMNINEIKEIEKEKKRKENEEELKRKEKEKENKIKYLESELKSLKK